VIIAHGNEPMASVSACPTCIATSKPSVTRRNGPHGANRNGNAAYSSPSVPQVTSLVSASGNERIATPNGSANASNSSA